MADTKITALTALTAADPANDVIPIVDVSDTTMAASGTTKKISVNNILGASGTATLASATITGNLTVDTSTLFVNSSTDRVGIGTVTPLSNLHVGGGTGLNNLGVGLSRGATTNFYEAFDGTKSFLAGTDSSQTGVKVGSLSNHSMFLVCNNITQLQIDPLGVFSFTDGAGGTRMTLNSTGLGVGVASPAYKLQATGLVVASDPSFSGSTNFIGAILNNDGTTPGIDIRRFTGTPSTHGTTYIATDATGATFFYNGVQASNTRATSLKMTLDASGNLLVGVASANVNGGVLQLKSGITFPATQVASSDVNTLDDYEEGTWTGTLKGSTTDPTVPVTATGRYTKIGRQILIEISFTNVSTVGAAGAISIAMTGLPGVTATRSMGNVSAWLGATFTGTLQAMIIEGTSVISLVSSVSNAANSDATHNAGTGRYFWITASFTV